MHELLQGQDSQEDRVSKGAVASLGRPLVWSWEYRFQEPHVGWRDIGIARVNECSQPWLDRTGRLVKGRGDCMMSCEGQWCDSTS